MTVNVDEARIRDESAKERRELAAILDGLPAEDWERPSLCAGWRVREVVAHVIMPFRLSIARFGLEMIKARGDFNRMADRCARRDATLPTAELAATLRDNAGHAWKPPGGGFAGALSHDVIHAMDITVALGIDRRIPEERLRIVLGNMNPKSVKFFGTDLEGVRLCAEDIDWSYGSGTPVSGLAQDLLLVVCGRRLPADRLRGEPAARFTAE